MSARIGLDVTLLLKMFGDPDEWSGISGSSAGATIECPARLALPQAHTRGEAATRGNELHAFARVCTVNPAAREKALADVPEKYRHTAAGMNLDLALDGLRVVGCERAYALDVKKHTVRFIGENIERDYNKVLEAQGKPRLGRYEIPFTLDVEAFAGDIPVELDYKSGQSIGPVEDHWQRRVCATGLMMFHDTATAISRVAYIWDNGEIKPDGYEFSILDAEEYCDTLVTAIDAVWTARLLLANGIMPDIFPSDSACNYCSAMTSCPYWMNIAKAMLGKLQAVEKGPELSTLTLEELGQVWDMAKKAEKILEPLFKGMKKVIQPGPTEDGEIPEVKPLPIGDKEVRPVPRSKTFFDASKARGFIVTLMQRSGATQEEIDAKIESLNGKTEYEEYRTVKRQLPMVGT